jgi:phosphoribosyl 1,2-cyclic phosphate phosphodiesterase
MGVPTLGCTCRVCTSADPRDRRSRPSAAVHWNDHCVIIDTGPDFREQALREGIRSVDAVFYTHSHADHVLGLDDLRPLSFLKKPSRIPLYADKPTARALESIFHYHFAPDGTYPHRARVQIHHLSGSDSVELFGASFQRIPLMHGDMEIAGFRFGRAAYLTDMNSIPDTSLELLRDLDVVVIDALRPQPHPSHSTISESIAWIEKLRPRSAWFTHMSHEVLHAETDPQLPAPIHLAYDGLRVPFEI